MPANLFTSAAGNLGKSRYTEGTNAEGTPYQLLTFGIATNSRTRAGKQITTWVNCYLWGARAKAVAPYMVSGQGLTAIGRPEAAMRPKKDGSVIAQLNLHVEDFTFIGKRPEGLEETISGEPAVEGVALPDAESEG
jgi:single-stranded DNA-binding protein